MQLRSATPADAPALLALYRPYVVETAITFELEPPTLAEFRGRLEAKLGKFPWLVAECEGEFVGYAYAGPFHARAAYAWTAEASVYVGMDSRGHGAGRALYGALLDELRAKGLVNVIGLLTLPNEPSVRLHERFGFAKVGQITNAGFKLGRWWDVGYWQLPLRKPGATEMPVEIGAR